MLWMQCIDVMHFFRFNVTLEYEADSRTLE